MAHWLGKDKEEITMIIKYDKEPYGELEAYNINLVPTTIDETYHHRSMLEVYTELLISLAKKNNFTIKLFISSGAYNLIEKYNQKNKIRKYLDKKYKLWGIPDLKSYWSSATGQEEEIIFDDETTIYADVVEVTVDNVQKSLNWCLQTFGNISLLTTHSFIFLVHNDANSNNLTAKNIVQNMLHARCPKYHSSRYCFDLTKVVNFFNENNAYPTFLFENHGTQIDFTFSIFAPKNILTLER